MGTVAVLAVAFTLAFALVVLGAAWVFHRLLQKMVGDRHAALEEIVSTGRVPDGWRRRSPEDPGHRRYLRRLDGLRKYVRTTSLVEDETARLETLDRLAAVRAAWERDEDGPAPPG